MHTLSCHCGDDSASCIAQAACQDLGILLGGEPLQRWVYRLGERRPGPGGFPPEVLLQERGIAPQFPMDLVHPDVSLPEIHHAPVTGGNAKDGEGAWPAVAAIDVDGRARGRLYRHDARDGRLAESLVAAHPNIERRGLYPGTDRVPVRLHTLAGVADEHLGQGHSGWDVRLPGVFLEKAPDESGVIAVPMVGTGPVEKNNIRTGQPTTRSVTWVAKLGPRTSFEVRRVILQRLHFFTPRVATVSFGTMPLARSQVFQKTNLESTSFVIPAEAGIQK